MLAVNHFMPGQNYRIFISYSRADEDHKKRLLIHLDSLAHDHTIQKPWHDRLIGAGDDWRNHGSGSGRLAAPLFAYVA